MKPLRLFMTTDAVGGVWTYSVDLARELAGRGVRTTLAVLGPEPRPDQRQAADGLKVVCVGLPLDWTADSPAALEKTAKVIAELARDADIIHLNSPALAAYARFETPVVGVCHSCLGTWWDAVRGGDLPDDFAWRADALRRGYAACDVLVAPTQAFAAATAARYGVKVRPVRNGRAARQADEPRSERVVFTAGRLWDEGKNLAVLDAAAVRLDAPVFAAGPTEGPNGERVSLPHLQLLGRLSDAETARWMGRAQVFVSTALYEPFGLSVLEAAQAGSALVLSDIPTFRELWDGAAVFVRPTPDAVAEATQALLDNSALAAQLGRAAIERSRAYTVEAMARGMLDIYRGVGVVEAAA